MITQQHSHMDALLSRHSTAFESLVGAWVALPSSRSRMMDGCVPKTLRTAQLEHFSQLPNDDRHVAFSDLAGAQEFEDAPAAGARRHTSALMGSAPAASEVAHDRCAGPRTPSRSACKFFGSPNGCRFGSHCKFLHHSAFDALPFKSAAERVAAALARGATFQDIVDVGDVLWAGSPAVLGGLSSAALNGKAGLLLDGRVSNGRTGVLLFDGSPPKSCKLINLLLAAPGPSGDVCCACAGPVRFVPTGPCDCAGHLPLPLLYKQFLFSATLHDPDYQYQYPTQKEEAAVLHGLNGSVSLYLSGRDPLSPPTPTSSVAEPLGLAAARTIAQDA
jgi:hypothetical protein